MFDRRRPCSNYPFRVRQGSRFALRPARLHEIARASAFQCHKTLRAFAEDEEEDDGGRQGPHPQQCAGLMAVLLAEGRANQIMQVGERLGAFDPAALEREAAYASWSEVEAAHLCGVEPACPNSRPNHARASKPQAPLQEYAA